MSVPEHKIELPESLATQLRDFERRLLRMETFVTVLGAACGFLLTYAILFLSDRLGNTPAWERVLLTFSGGAIVAGFCWTWLHHWWWRRRNTRDLAKQVQRQYGRLGDRLLGIVELTEGTAATANMSPAICRAAIRQVAEEASRYDFKQAVGMRWPKIAARAFLALLILVAVPCALFPHAGWNTFLRWGKPFSNVARYTFVNIESIPDCMVVPHGEEYDIECVLANHSRWRPAHATFRIDNQPPVESQLSRGRVRFHLPGATRETTLTLRLGDLVKTIRVTPAYRPELVRMTATITPPDYLEHHPYNTRIEGGRITLLEGGHVTLTGIASRALKSALSLQETVQAASVQSNEFTLPHIPAGTLTNPCTFTWVDIHGMSGATPYRLNATVLSDEAPRVECRGIDRAIAILQDEVIPISIRGEDDFGIQKLWVEWTCSTSDGKGAPALGETHAIGNGGPERTEIEGPYAFSPFASHIPEDTTVTLCAFATDYYPGRKPAASVTHRIHVLSRTRHAKLIQEQMEAIHARLEERAREEERLLEQNRALRALSKEQLSDDSRTAAIKESKAQEQANAEQTAQLTKEAMELLKEALRNKAISEATLREWAELTDALGKLSQTEMKQAAKALEQAAANAAQRSAKLDDAIALESLILQALRRSEQKANRLIEDMQSQGFVNRLLFVASQEATISTTLKTLLPSIAGMSTADLPPDTRKSMEQLTRRQEDAGKEAGYIQDDLLAFFNRTRAEVYSRLHKEMTAKETTSALKQLAVRIQDNIAMQAVGETTHWSNQFTEWANRLRKGKNKGDGGGDGDGSSGEGRDPDAAEIEVIMGLMRARQREEGLRDQTRIAEQRKADSASYPVDAEKLGIIQDELANDVWALDAKDVNDQLRQLVKTVGREMIDVSVLLRRPQTDSETIGAETYIIELLANEAGGGKGGAGSSAGKAASLMMRMGLMPGKGHGSGAGPAGGGSTMGGANDKPNAPTGDGGGETPEAHSVDKASGAVGTEWPEEFREALEDYFRVMEEKK